MTRSIVAALLLGLWCAAARADEAKDSARKAIADATQLHKAGKYREALDKMMLAYALDPQKDLLYAIAQLHVKLNQCPEAITFYRRYLAARPEATSAEKARQGILACENQPAVEPKLEPKPEPKPEPKAVVVPKVEPPRRETSAWYADPVGDTLTGTGLALSAIGVVEFLRARSAFSDASAAVTYQARTDGYDDAHSKRTISVAFGASGVALGIAGVIRYATRHPAAEPVAVVPVGRGGLITWMARW